MRIQKTHALKAWQIYEQIVLKKHVNDDFQKHVHKKIKKHGNEEIE